MSESRNNLEDELRQEDEEYRYAYAEDFLNTSVATQIRVLREQRGLTQEDLAQKIGTKQAGISRLENVNYSAWKTETLRKIARAMKVRLKITFETFGSLVDEAETFSRKNLERPTFEDDPRFSEGVAAPLQTQTSITRTDNGLLTVSLTQWTNANQPVITTENTIIVLSSDIVTVHGVENRSLGLNQNMFSAYMQEISVDHTPSSSVQTLGVNPTDERKGDRTYVGKSVATAA